MITPLNENIFMKKIIYLFFLVFLISACNNSSTYEVPNQISTRSNTVDTLYPGLRQSTSVEAYPGSEGLYLGIPTSDIKGTFFPKDEWPSAPSSAPDPKSGMGSISGTIFSFTTRIVLSDTMFYLTPAVGPDNTDLPPVLFGPQEDSGDVVGRTDKNGQFFLDNVPPGNYLLIVEAPMNWAVGLEEDKDSAPRLITIKEGNKYPLGVVFISWP